MSDNFPYKDIYSLNEYLNEIKLITESWYKINDHIISPWFRGQSSAKDKPVPSLFHPNCNYDEFWMNMSFRNKASTFDNKTPDVERLDSWLFLMQHLGLPTRLLDWTESPLIALFFSLINFIKNPVNNDNPAIWIIHPFELNKQSIGSYSISPTWDPTKIVFRYFQIAFYQFQNDNDNDIEQFTKIVNVSKIYLTYPLAVQTSYVHPRMQAQKSVFTIHGFDKSNFEDLFIDTDLVKNGFLRKLVIKGNTAEMFKDLENLGITESVVFPDLEGLARELKLRFKYK